MRSADSGESDSLGDSIVAVEVGLQDGSSSHHLPVVEAGVAVEAEVGVAVEAEAGVVVVVVVAGVDVDDRPQGPQIEERYLTGIFAKVRKLERDSNQGFRFAKPAFYH